MKKHWFFFCFVFVTMYANEFMFLYDFFNSNECMFLYDFFFVFLQFFQISVIFVCTRKSSDMFFFWMFAFLLLLLLFLFFWFSNWKTYETFVTWAQSFQNMGKVRDYKDSDSDSWSLNCHLYKLCWCKIGIKSYIIRNQMIYRLQITIAIGCHIKMHYCQRYFVLRDS